MSSSDFFRLAMYGYVGSTLLYIIHLVFRDRKVGYGATAITGVAFLSHTTAILLRWKESYDLGFGHAPLSNMYESMVFFSWSIIAIYLYFEWKYKTRALGAILTPLAFLAIASVSLHPGITKEIEPLVPALQSNWLTSHVVTCFFGYAAFAVSFAVSFVYLILSAESPREVSWWAGRLALPAVIATVTIAVPTVGAKAAIWGAAAVAAALMFWLGGPLRAKVTGLFPNVKILDDLNYRSIMVGFPLLTLGIVTGAAWANYAWGTYWSWDPKETWSLITWFVYAAFLHARFTAGWRGKKSALLSIVGFAAVLFTYIGVNFLLSGLHSYGSS
jgi:cytochrome c-type biogenesis protein CcsB